MNVDLTTYINGLSDLQLQELSVQVSERRDHLRKSIIKRTVKNHRPEVLEIMALPRKVNQIKALQDLLGISLHDAIGLRIDLEDFLEWENTMKS